MATTYLSGFGLTSDPSYVNKPLYLMRRGLRSSSNPVPVQYYSYDRLPLYDCLNLVDLACLPTSSYIDCSRTASTLGITFYALGGNYHASDYHPDYPYVGFLSRDYYIKSITAREGTVWLESPQEFTADNSIGDTHIDDVEIGFLTPKDLSGTRWVWDNTLSYFPLFSRFNRQVNIRFVLQDEVSSQQYGAIVFRSNGIEYFNMSTGWVLVYSRDTGWVDQKYKDILILSDTTFATNYKKDPYGRDMHGILQAMLAENAVETATSEFRFLRVVVDGVAHQVNTVNRQNVANVGSQAVSCGTGPFVEEPTTSVSGDTLTMTGGRACTEFDIYVDGVPVSRVEAW